MNIKQMNTIEPTRFENEAARGVSGRVLIGKSDGAPHFCMRVFELEKGGYTPRHQHDWEHEVFVHAGQGAVLANGHWSPLAPGSSVFIPPNAEHQFKNAGDVPFVFVCVVPDTAPEL